MMIFGKKPKLDSIEFGTEGWSVLEESNAHRVYSTNAGDVVRLAFNRFPPKWTFDLTSLDMATEFYQKQSEELGGAMLSLDIETYSNVETLNGVFKYRSPDPESLGMYFVAMTVMPFKKFNYQFNIECVETGMTGGREATVAALLMRQGKLPKAESSEAEQVDTCESLFSKLQSSRIRAIPADDVKYDEHFPNHPLTIVRDTQYQILDSLVVPDWVAKKPKFRVFY